MHFSIFQILHPRDQAVVFSFIRDDCGTRIWIGKHFALPNSFEIIQNFSSSFSDGRLARNLREHRITDNDDRLITRIT